MSTAIIRILPLLLAFATVGCAGPSFDYNGRWEGSHKLTSLPGEDKLLMRTIARVQLDIKDNKFELVQESMPYSGTVSYGSGKALLNLERIMGQPLESQGKDASRIHPPIELVPQADGTILFTDAGSMIDKSPVMLKRAPQPASR